MIDTRAQNFPRANLVSGNGSWPDLDLRPARDPDPLIPPGLYDGRGIKGEVHHSLGGRLKFFLTLELIGGPHDGVKLQFISTLPRKGRGIAPSSKYYRAWTVANGGRRPTRRDRMSPGIFRDRQVDHVIPRHRGGDDGEDNVRGVCKPCHGSKSGREGQASR